MTADGQGAGDDLTIWLRRLGTGDAEAERVVSEELYKQLWRIASGALGAQPHNSLQPTLLVNEAFMRLFRGRHVDWNDRFHFYSTAARSMRRIVIDHFRAKRADMRPTSGQQVSLDDVVLFDDSRCEEALIIDEALQHLSKVNERAARVVELHYFGGLTFGQISEILGVVDRTIKRDWLFARGWLKCYLDGSDLTAR